MRSNWKVGDRVELHPATDRWMAGDRYGEIVMVHPSGVKVKMDRSGATIVMLERDLGRKLDIT